MSNSNDLTANVCHSIEKHKICNWGDCDSEGAHQNDLAYESGGRILSVFKNPASHEELEPKIWITTLV